MACGIIFPQPGIKLASPALEGRLLTTEPLGKPFSNLEVIVWENSDKASQRSYLLSISKETQLSNPKRGEVYRLKQQTEHCTTALNCLYIE